VKLKKDNKTSIASDLHPQAAEDVVPDEYKFVPHPLEEAARQMICHENEVTNHRVSWLLTLEGLLFAALGFAWDKPDGKPLIWVFCFLGALVALSAWSVLDGSQLAIERLRKWWIDFPYKSEKSPGILGYCYEPKRFPKLFPWLLPWRAFPILFVTAWLLVATINFWRTSPSHRAAPEVFASSDNLTRQSRISRDQIAIPTVEIITNPMGSPRLPKPDKPFDVQVPTTSGDEPVPTEQSHAREPVTKSVSNKKLSLPVQ
jgi:hypothetical protein